MSTTQDGPRSSTDDVPPPPRIYGGGPWTAALLVMQVGFVALWICAAIVTPSFTTTLCVAIAASVLAWTCWLTFRRTDAPPGALDTQISTTIVTAVWLGASSPGVLVSLLPGLGPSPPVLALLGGVAAVWLSRLRPAPRPSKSSSFRLLQVSTLSFFGVGLTIFVLMYTELTPEFEGANIGGAIAVSLVGGPLATAGLTTLILGLVAEVARPRSWSWLFLAAAAAGVLQIAHDISANLTLGCPPPSRADTGPPADFSFIPPGVNCIYDLGPNTGSLIIEPSLFPTFFVASCVVAYLLLRRSERANRR